MQEFLIGVNTSKFNKKMAEFIKIYPERTE